MQENEFDCKKCVNQGSLLCSTCTYLVNSKGIKRPKHFRPIQESVIKINIQEAVIPPLGVKPKYIHDQERAVDLSNALIRYLQIGLPIPIEWVEEYNSLRTKENKNQSRGNSPQ